MIGAGLLTETHLQVLGRAGLLVAIVGGTAVAAARGWWMMGLGVLGVAGATLYTAWPVRAAYRPFVGELVAFVCVVCCVVGGYGVQTGGFAAEALLVGSAHGAVCVAMLMLHHYLDRGPDERAAPQKRTSVVALGTTARWYATTWAVIASGLFVVAAVAVGPFLIAPAVAAAITIPVYATTPLDHPLRVTQSERVVIVVGIYGALIGTALLAPALTWLLIIPAVLIGVEAVLTARYLPPAPTDATPHEPVDNSPGSPRVLNRGNPSAPTDA